MIVNKLREIVEFAVSAENKVKMKEREKRDKYLDLARDLKKLWNIKVTVTPIELVRLEQSQKV